MRELISVVLCLHLLVRNKNDKIELIEVIQVPHVSDV